MVLFSCLQICSKLKLFLVKLILWCGNGQFHTDLFICIWLGFKFHYSSNSRSFVVGLSIYPVFGWHQSNKIILLISLTMPQFLYLKIAVIPSSVRYLKFSASTFRKYFQILEWKMQGTVIKVVIQLRQNVKGIVICFQIHFHWNPRRKIFKKNNDGTRINCWNCRLICWTN